MRRNRRMILIDRVIPFLAAGVGLIALAGSVVVQMNTDARTAAVMREMAELRRTVEAVALRAETVASAQDDGTAEGLLALQDRMVALEDQVATSAAELPATAPGPAPTAVAEIDPDLPTTDCIPLGTRFMVIPDESYPMCQSATVIQVGAITGESVDVLGAGPIIETGFGRIVGTECTVMVFSADIEGFAEMRVNCS